MTLFIGDIGWIAGFFEGEAWFGSANSGGTPIISVSQVQKEPLGRLLRMLGGSMRQIPGRGKRQDYWRWEIYGPLAAGSMMTVYQLMSPKRQDSIRSILLAWVQCKDHRRTLSWEQIAGIRKRLAGGDTVSSISRDMGVGRSAITNIKFNRCWRV